MNTRTAKLLPVCHKEAGNLDILLVCDGAANVGLIGYLAAVELTREDKARMCCITPIGAKMSTYIDIARKAKKLIVINGCQNQCAKRVLEQAGIEVKHNIIVSEIIRKLPIFDITEEDIAKVKKKIEEEIAKE